MTRWIPLEERWSRRENTATHRALWSREAYLYDRQSTADWRTEGFMKVVAELDLLTTESTVLDVGCGAGVYTAAFAQRAGDVLGVDLSASMVEAGRRRAQRENLPNLRFEVLDWRDADMDAMDWRAKYDVVTARMTPAVSDARSFGKFVACGRKHGIYENFIQRKHRWMERAYRIAGIDGRFWHDEQIPYALEYLFGAGLRPQIRYRDGHWGEPARPWSRVADFCLGRLELHQPITDEQREAVRKDFEAQAVDGMLDARETLTLVTLSWNY